MTIEKIKILGAVLELPAKQSRRFEQFAHETNLMKKRSVCQSSHFTSKMGQIGQIGSAV